MVFKGVSDDSSLTTGLLTNEITGSYPQPLTTLDQLKASPKRDTSTPGPSFASDALVISNLKGALKDVKVRQALSMAIDRKAYINTLYKGYAQLPRTLANPGTWGYEQRRLPGRLGQAARADPGRGQGQAARQGGGRDRQDDRDRHPQRDQLAADRGQRASARRRSASA